MSHQPRHWSELQLDFPRTSLIWPNPGDLLEQTAFRVPDIHSPVDYEAGNVFVALFSCHVEDADLCFINHLYSGHRVWDVIVAPHRVALEEQLRLANPAKDCGQFSRHQAISIPKHMLETWNVLII